MRDCSRRGSSSKRLTAAAAPAAPAAAAPAAPTAAVCAQLRRLLVWLVHVAGVVRSSRDADKT